MKAHTANQIALTGLSNATPATILTHRGFSLLELIIAMAILAIIAGIATPTWRMHLQSARRMDAISLLNHIALRQEQFRIQQRRYANGSELYAPLPAGLGITKSSYYRLSATSSTLSYRVTASVDPLGSQARDSQCWALTMDESGNHWAENRAGQETTKSCWSE